MITVTKNTALAALALVVGFAISAQAAEMTAAEVESPITREQAREIALQRVSDGKIIDFEFNDRWFSDNDYEFTVVDDTNRYDIQIDAKTGEVLKVNQKAIFQDSLSGEQRQRVSEANSVSPERVRQIAMERAPNAQIVDMERELDNDRVVYDLELMGANSRIDMTVDGMSGDILSYDEETVDRDENSVRFERRAFNRDVRSNANHEMRYNNRDARLNRDNGTMRNERGSYNRNSTPTNANTTR